MQELIVKWRREAAQRHTVSSNDVDIRITLRGCADELERAWHDHAHDGEWKDGCPICDTESQS